MKKTTKKTNPLKGWNQLAAWIPTATPRQLDAAFEREARGLRREVFLRRILGRLHKLQRVARLEKALKRRPHATRA